MTHYLNEQGWHEGVVQLEHIAHANEQRQLAESVRAATDTSQDDDPAVVASWEAMHDRAAALLQDGRDAEAEAVISAFYDALSKEKIRWA